MKRVDLGQCEEHGNEQTQNKCSAVCRVLKWGGWWGDRQAETAKNRPAWMDHGTVTAAMGVAGSRGQRPHSSPLHTPVQPPDTLPSCKVSNLIPSSPSFLPSFASSQAAPGEPGVANFF